MDEAANDFAALLVRVRRGDDRALAQLVEQYAAVIHRAARAMLSQVMRSQLDTVDVVQSVHRTLLIGLRDEKFDISSPDKLVSLALTLVRRKIARQWRTMKRQPEISPPEITDPVAQANQSPPDPAKGPAEAAQLKDEVNYLLSSLDKLDRRLVELRLKGYTTADVARELGIDPAVLRVRLGRLRKRLRDDGVSDEGV